MGHYHSEMKHPEALPRLEPPIEQKRLRGLARRWRTKADEFDECARRERSFAIECGDEAGYRRHCLDSSCYRGEALALRWCAEDLEKLLTKEEK